MRKILIILAVATIVAAAGTGCQINADLNSPLVIEDIYVRPNDWVKAIDERGFFNHYYCDVPLPEITERIFNSGSFHTYLVYDEERDGEMVTVQEELPYIVTGDRFVGIGWEPYEEIIACSYEIGYMRITISRLPMFEKLPDKSLYFRTLIVK